MKAHASEVLWQRNEQSEPMIITQHGEAKFVMQDVQSYEKTQEIMALLKILALGNTQIENKKLKSLKSAFQHVRKSRK